MHSVAYLPVPAARCPLFGVPRRMIVVAWVVLLSATGTVVAQQAPNALDAMLEAGEFGPAQQLAHDVQNPQQRNQWLSRIALAQNDSGARFAAASTLSQVTNDLVRSTALDRMAGSFFGGGQPNAQGGGPQADFDSLIELITTTIAPTSWDEVGGPGAISEFEGGVFVNAAGVLQRLVNDNAAGDLVKVHRRALRHSTNGDIHRHAELRMVSLPKLERAVQLLWAQGREPDAAMQALAGLNKIRYVLVYPATRDVVLAGEAGSWTVNDERRWVSEDSGRPILRLDDLVVLLRNAFGNSPGRFRCSIDPIPENLARTKKFLEESAKKPLRPGRAARDRWLQKLSDNMGQQIITVEGIDPRTRVARTIVEADYRMKLLGMGLEEGTLEVESYLDSIKVPRGSSPPPLDMVRWWFTLDYQAVHSLKNRHAFEWRGQGVKVLSEKELLAENGRRVPTGKSHELAAEFAHRFTQHFKTLAVKYPIYAELQNIFDLALATTLMGTEDLPAQVGWHMTHFGDPKKFQVDLAAAPERVDTVINHRLIHRTRILAGASGGVSVNALTVIKDNRVKFGTFPELEYQHTNGTPQGMLPDAWWWDIDD